MFLMFITLIRVRMDRILGTPLMNEHGNKSTPLKHPIQAGDYNLHSGCVAGLLYYNAFVFICFISAALRLSAV